MDDKAADKKSAIGQMLKGLGQLISGSVSLYVAWVIYSIFWGDGLSRAPSSLPPRPAVTESCQNLTKLFGPSSHYSDLQKKEFFKNRYVGAPFKWKLKVGNVGKTFGKIYLSAKCVPSSSLVFDISLAIDKTAIDEALTLQKGQVYEFTGVLEDFGNFTGLSALYTGVKK